MKFIKIGIVFSVIGAFVFACNQPTTTVNTNTVNNSNAAVVNTNANAQPTAAADEMAATRKIYKDMCAKCHKDDGSGGKTEIEGTTINAENLTSDKMKNMSDAKYVDYIKNGIPDEGMPAFKDRLTDRQINDVIKFIRTEFQGK